MLLFKRLKLKMESYWNCSKLNIFSKNIIKVNVKDKNPKITFYIKI